MKHLVNTLVLALLITAMATVALAEEKDDEKDDSPLSDKTFSGLELRSIGPAF